jgi:hypothetical protein
LSDSLNHGSKRLKWEPDIGTDMAREKYAYGDTKVDGQPCVAKAHDGDLAGELLTVAEEYDEVGYERHGSHQGTVPESEAQEMWDRAIDRIQARLNVERDPDHAAYLQRAISQAEDLQETAFA